MKIYIKSDKMKFTVPLPNALLKLGISLINSKFVQRYIPEKDKKYINIINFKKLSNCIDLLKDYRDLKIVDVQSRDGRHVTIIL